MITPVRDTCDYLDTWFSSLRGQTLPRERLEVIAVDDGSTDGSGRALDRIQRAYPELVRVLHLPASGGPAGPRNRALELARGRYVFFLDSDDRLGPEALERLTGYADRLESDVVLGRMAGVNGRRVPKDVFRHSVEQAEIHNSGVLYALTPAKLFRRELIERHRLRFRDELRIGSDHPFVVEAYLRARRVSVLADYTCYYLVARERGGNISLGDSVTSALRLPYMRASVETVLRHAGPGPVLDALLKRVLRVEFTDLLGPAFTRLAPEAQLAEMAALRGYLDDWYHDALGPELPSWVRWRIHCVREGKRAELCALIGTETADRLGFRSGNGAGAGVLASAGRAYARLPGFRDPGSGIPDSCYEVTRELAVRHRLADVALDQDGLTVTGTAALPALARAGTGVRVFARRRGSRVTFPLHTVQTAAEGAGEAGESGPVPGTAFRARWGSGADRWRPGIWDLFAVLDAEGVRREVRLGSARAPGLALPGPRPPSEGPAGELPVACYWTDPYGNLSLRVG
ncbi:glycosyltransferase family 2 protein [Streptacidiphilus cavernicola]|uniref:Glycosyltransferase family 2 protein n=1 Tax=Streptacidiphilus cavernicola TaxID=3342716 RepID=A0ABV6VTG3_9ACTN